MTEARGRRRPSVTLRVLLWGYTAGILLVTLSPSAATVAPGGFVRSLLALLHGVGVPAWFDDAMLEFVANVGMFVPFGVLLGLLTPRHRRALAFAAPVALTLFIESMQAFFLPERVADVRDLVANSLGGWIGLLLGFGILRLSRLSGHADACGAGVPTPSGATSSQR